MSATFPGCRQRFPGASSVPHAPIAPPAPPVRPISALAAPGNDMDGASMSPKQHRWSIDAVSTRSCRATRWPFPYVRAETWGWCDFRCRSTQPDRAATAPRRALPGTSERFPAPASAPRHQRALPGTSEHSLAHQRAPPSASLRLGRTPGTGSKFGNQALRAGCWRGCLSAEELRQWPGPAHGASGWAR